MSAVRIAGGLTVTFVREGAIVEVKWNRAVAPEALRGQALRRYRKARDAFVNATNSVIEEGAQVLVLDPLTVREAGNTK